MATFDDGKEEGALRTIGEVSSATGIKAHVLRYWEQQFAELAPLTRSGGRRYYRTEDIRLIERINRLVNAQGYTLKGAKAALKTGPEAMTAPAARPETAPTDDTAALSRLRSIRASLQAALTD